MPSKDTSRLQGRSRSSNRLARRATSASRLLVASRRAGSASSTTSASLAVASSRTAKSSWPNWSIQRAIGAGRCGGSGTAGLLGQQSRSQQKSASRRMRVGDTADSFRILAGGQPSGLECRSVARPQTVPQGQGVVPVLSAESRRLPPVKVWYPISVPFASPKKGFIMSSKIRTCGFPGPHGIRMPRAFFPENARCFPQLADLAIVVSY